MTRTSLFALSLVATLLAVTAPGLQAVPAPASDLESITISKEGPVVTIAVGVRGEFGNESFKLREPERLVIDLSPVDGIAAPPQIEINAGGVLRVRTGRFQAGVARLVFDLDGPGIMYRIEMTAGGLKVTFWKEGASALRSDEKAAAPKAPPVHAKAVPAPLVKAPAAPALAPVVAPAAKPIESPAPTAAAGKPGRGFFVLVESGVGTFLSSESVFTRDFPINNLKGTAVSTFKPKLNTPAALSFGRYVKLQEMSVKLGFDVEYWNFKSDGAHVFTVPNPVSPEGDRTLTTTSSFRSYFTSASAYGLVRLYANGALTVSAGPEIGYVFGKFRFLDTIDIQDAPPYTEADVSLIGVSYTEKNASSLLAGLRAGFEYALSSKLSLVLDLNVRYAGPEIADLSNKLGLSQAGAVIGIQYNF